MALALILMRNASGAQVGTLQRLLASTSSVIGTRDFSCSFRTNYHSALTKETSGLCLMKCVSPQVRLMSADHSKLWPIEKALSASLLLLIPGTVAAPNVVLDNLAAIASVIHFHWGLEAVVVDYARPIIVGNILPKLAMALLYLISVTTLGGLIYYNINDIGIGRTIRKFWAIKK